jgi:hypothetical protein
MYQAKRTRIIPNKKAYTSKSTAVWTVNCGVNHLRISRESITIFQDNTTTDKYF